MLTVKQPSHTPRHRIQPSYLNGTRPDLVWRRIGKRDYRPDLTGSDLLDAAQGVHTRAGERKFGSRRVTDTDLLTLQELEARSYCWAELKRARVVVPTWFSLLGVHPKYFQVVALLLHAYRAGALGCMASYEEWMARLDIGSRATWTRWIKHLEGKGVIRVLPTWKFDEQGRQSYARSHYRIGPEMERIAGVALCENATTPLGPNQRWVQRMAASLRRNVGEYWKEKKQEHWQRCRQAGAASRQEPVDGGGMQLAHGGTEPADGGGTDLARSGTVRTVADRSGDHGARQTPIRDAVSERGLDVMQHTSRSFVSSLQSGPPKGAHNQGHPSGVPHERPTLPGGPSQSEDRAGHPYDCTSSDRTQPAKSPNNAPASATDPDPTSDGSEDRSWVYELAAPLLAKFAAQREQEALELAQRLQHANVVARRNKITCDSCGGSGGMPTSCTKCLGCGYIDPNDPDFDDSDFTEKPET